MSQSSPIDYNAFATTYQAQRKASQRVLDVLIEAAGLVPAGDILEIGCGTGNYLAALSRLLPGRGFGLDRSAGMLDQAGRRQLPVCQAQAGMPLPFQAGRFGLVFSVDFIHYLQPDELVFYFEEIRRVLRPGGVSITATDSDDDIQQRTMSIYFPETVAIERQRYHPIERIQGAQRTAGFAQVDNTHSQRSYPIDETTLARFQHKAFSALHYLAEPAFRRGLQRLEADMRRGPVPGREVYTYVWGVKPADDGEANGES